MNAQPPSLETRDDHKADDFSIVAARLVEAACLVRIGNGEAAKAHIARAIALLRGEPSTIPANLPPLSGTTLQVVRGGLATWQKRRLTAYIDAHLTESIRVADLAGLLDLSESHFGRAFRCSFGISAHEYITRRRIEVAQSLMLESREPLSAIALRSGLSEQSHFTRVFRRIVGETPYAWRRARWGDVADRPVEQSTRATNRHGVSALSSRVAFDY